MEVKELVVAITDPCQPYEVRVRAAVEFIEGLQVQSITMVMSKIWVIGHVPPEVFDVCSDALDIVRKMAEYRAELDKEVHDVA